MSESLLIPVTAGSPAGYGLYQRWVSLVEYQSLSSAASFPPAAWADWDKIKWEGAAYCWCCHMIQKHKWQCTSVQKQGMKQWANSHTSLSEHNTFQRPKVCWECGFVFPSGKKVYINTCFVTGTHWPQDLKLLLWHVLWYHWFSAGFDWPWDSSLLWCICTCCGFVSIDKPLVSSSTSCRQGSGQAQGFPFSLRLPQIFGAC